MIYLFLAEGFEEIEALAPLDILRRAGQCVKTVGVTGSTVTGAHAIPVVCDVTVDSLAEQPEAVILPGGMPGTLNLEKSETVCRLVRQTYEQGGLVCAICAAPSILGHMGLLAGKRATCFPGFEKDLLGAELSPDSVCRDGNIITAKGAGVALDFGFCITQALCGAETAQQIHDAIQCP